MNMVKQSETTPEAMDENFQRSENQQGPIFEARNVFICNFLPDFKITYINPSCCLYYGSKPEKLIGKSFLTLIPSRQHQASVQRHLSSLSPENPVIIYELNSAAPNGEIVWQQWYTRAKFSGLKNLIEFQSLGRDITRRMRSEVALWETKRRYQAVVEHQMELVCRYLPDCTLTFANQAYCRHHEKEQNELIGKSFLSSIRPDHQEKLLAFLKSADPEHPVSTQTQCITKSSGESLWVEWRRRALFDDSGNLYEVQSVGRDITEIINAEEALKVSEKALREKNIELERKNAALMEVLEQIELQKQQIKNDVIANVDDLLIPILEQLMSEESQLDKQYLNLTKRSLEDLTSSFGRKITQKSLKLTPKEIQICNMIRRGLSSKEIAGFLNISLHTVGRHRHSIRKKADIINKGESLYAFLQNL